MRHLKPFKIFEAEVTPKGKAQSQETPLVIAAGKGATAAIKKYLQEGSDPKANYNAALRKAIYTNQLEAVKVLLATNDFDTSQEAQNQMRQVFDYAVQQDWNEMLELLRSNVTISKMIPKKGRAEIKK